MALESPTYISQLVASNPTDGDPVSQGDNHIRNNKFVLKSTFPGAAGQGFAKAITTTEDELNNLNGLDAPIVDFINDTVATSTGTVGTTQLVDGAVTTNKLALEAVTSAEVNIAQMQGAGLLPTAWVKFSNAGSLIGSYNVSSVTKLTEGSYDVNFAVAMGNTAYVVNATGTRISGANDIVSPALNPDPVNNTVNKVKVNFKNSEGNNTSIEYGQVLIFGGR